MVGWLSERGVWQSRPDVPASLLGFLPYLTKTWGLVTSHGGKLLVDTEMWLRGHSGRDISKQSEAGGTGRVGVTLRVNWFHSEGFRGSGPVLSSNQF